MSAINWVKLEKYCADTGETPDAVHSRRKAGKWLDNVQCKVVDGRLWINVKKAQDWIESWSQNKKSQALN